MTAIDLCRLAHEAFPAHADALACRAEYEPAPTVSAPAQLLLF